MKTPTAEIREFQTFRLFATLALLTLIAVLLFRVVLFGPSHEEKLLQSGGLLAPSAISADKSGVLESNAGLQIVPILDSNQK